MESIGSNSSSHSSRSQSTPSSPFVDGPPAAILPATATEMIVISSDDESVPSFLEVPPGFAPLPDLAPFPAANPPPPRSPTPDTAEFAQALQDFLVGSSDFPPPVVNLGIAEDPEDAVASPPWSPPPLLPSMRPAQRRRLDIPSPPICGDVDEDEDDDDDARSAEPDEDEDLLASESMPFSSEEDDEEEADGSPDAGGQGADEEGDSSNNSD
jgi:hypothetical protein